MSETPKENPFDKVKLVSMIATLEAQVDGLQTSLQQSQLVNQELAKALKSHAARTSRVMNFPLEKIPQMVQSIRAWVAEPNRVAFDQVAADPGFQQALGMSVRALFVEVLGGNKDA